jgi:hypothetical protein
LSAEGRGGGNFIVNVSDEFAYLGISIAVSSIIQMLKVIQLALIIAWPNGSTGCSGYSFVEENDVGALGFPNVLRVIFVVNCQGSLLKSKTHLKTSHKSRICVSVSCGREVLLLGT